MNNINWLNGAFAVAGSFIGWSFGEFQGLLAALLTFTILDYITGVVSAAINKQLSSEIGAKGIFKKVMIFIIVGVSHLADVYMLGDFDALQTAVIFFYIANEGLSLIENAAEMGLPVPEQLTKFLAQLKDKKGEKK